MSRAPAAPATPPAVEPERLAAVQAALLAWFAAHGRDLPWRRTRDPWRVLVSEVMLQQIQVSRAVPFYEAFLARFPTVADLAAAPLAEAIRVWGDLGRYRRVVNLHRTAQILVAEHDGVIPSDPAALRRLPGIGPYTAGAVACFAFGRDEAFMDTNQRRVLHRVFLGPEAPQPAASEAELQALARAVVPPGRGWDWNQGLMDLGATICAARKPGCAGCPLRAHCRAEPSILSVLPRRAPAARPAYRYEGSDRFYRGRVLAHLRDHPAEDPEGIPLRDLGARIRDDFSDDHLPWLHGVVASLTKDGLAVAEERPAYDAGGDAPDDPPELWVKLPA